MRALHGHLPSPMPWTAWVLTLLGALLLKLDYHRATVQTLRWILGPTARLVAALRDQPLLFDPVHGYVAMDGSFVIAPACAGVNFLIIAFVVAVLGFVHRFPHPRQRAAWVLGAAAGAYVLTVVVNALRIVLAVALYQADAQLGWLTADRIHRVAGTAIFVLTLLGEWHVLDRLCARLTDTDADFARRHWAWLVSGAYFGLTLLVPVLNGAWSRHYLEHALSVVVTAAVMVIGTKTLARCSPPGVSG